MAVYLHNVTGSTEDVEAPGRLEVSSSTFGRQIKLTNVRWTLGDQGDLTEAEAIAEARKIMANPEAHEWLPMKAARTKPDA